MLLNVATRLVIGPAAPRPHLEAPLARRTAIVAISFFLASALHLALRGPDLPQLQRAFPLYALGGFSILIFGTSRLLIAGMAGRDIVGGARTSIATVVLASVGALGLYAAPAHPLAPLAASVWSLAALLHVMVIVASARRAPTRTPIADPTATQLSRAPIRVLETGSLAYAVASAIALPLGYAGLLSLASALHVVLVGFVIVTIMSVVPHILPRFTRVPVSVAPLWILGPLALAGPAFMALGLDRWRAALPAGAVLEGLAFATFGVLVVAMLARSRLRRASQLGYAAAPLAIGVGGILALAFAVHGAFAGQLATHGLLNVYGFVGLVVIAASTDLYGPALGPGAKPAKRHAALAVGTLLAALAVAAAGAGLGQLDVARAGMLAYAAGIAWQLAGLASAHWRAERVVARLR